MRRLILFALFLFCAAPVFAQEAATATITIQRKGTTAAAATRSLQRDIERFVKSFAPDVVRPTPKDAQNACTAFRSAIIGGDIATVIDLEIYNRNPDTCAPAILQSGLTDLKGTTVLEAVLQRLVRVVFNLTTDQAISKEKTEAAERDASTERQRRRAEEQPEGAQERKP